MADDLDLPATGSTIATDDIGGRHFQRVKLTAGPDGTADDLATREGDADGATLLRVCATPMASLDVLDGLDTTAQTYAAGDVIGGEQVVSETRLEATGSPLVVSISAADASGIGPDIDVFLSSSNFGGHADGDVFNPDFNLLNSCDYIVVSIAAADWVGAGSGKKVVTKPVGMRIPAAYGAYKVNVVARSSYTMATDGDFRLAVVTDFS